MALMELNLDAFLACRHHQKLTGLSLPGVVTIGLLSGVDGFCVTYDGRSPSFSERDLELLLATSADMRFNLRITPRADLLQLSLDLPVQQITFVADDLFKNYGADLESFIPKLKDAGRMVSFHVDPEISQLKKAYRLHADFIEIDTRFYSDSPSPHSQAEAREQLLLVTRTAEKNNMGASVAGGITYQNVTPLINIEAIENIQVGRAILGRAIFVGLETAIRDFKGLTL